MYSPAPLRGGEARKPRIVYFIASHKNPEQIARLVRACRSGSPDSRVLLHHDYSVSNLDPEQFKSIGNVDILCAEKPVGWGGFGLCAATLRGTRWLMDNHDFDWVVHLSGQDYPIRPLADIERDLAHTTHDGFALTYGVHDVDWHVGPARYLYQYYDVPKFPGWLKVRDWVRSHEAGHRAAGTLPRACVAPAQGFSLGVRPLRGPFRDGFECYKGATWWTLNRRSIEAINEYVDENPSLLDHYRRSQFAPDESMIPTILRNNSSLNLVTNDHRRFIRWTNADGGHPDLLTRADFGAMVASGKDFARKIDVHKDAGLLDLLEAHIGLQPAELAASA